MKQTLMGGMAVLALLAGCASTTIRPIAPGIAEQAHRPGSELRGYVVYAPVVVVEVSAQEVCVGKDDKGRCAMQTQCVAGKPFLLPDYSRPYLLDTHAGLGSASMDVTIADGWRLGSLKEAADNGDLVGIVQKLVTRGSPPGTAPSTGDCRPAGLYRVAVEEGAITLAPLLVY